jgi:1-acyl-sn-glycerol-3-phosphate acyltransferase
LAQSIWNTLRTEGLQAVVRYGTPERAQGRERRVWAQDLRAEVARLIDLPIGSVD